MEILKGILFYCFGYCIAAGIAVSTMVIGCKLLSKKAYWAHIWSDLDFNEIEESSKGLLAIRNRSKLLYDCIVVIFWPVALPIVTIETLIGFYNHVLRINERAG